MTSTDTSKSQELFSPPRSHSVVVNSRCAIFEHGEERVVFVCGEPIYRYHRDDAFTEKLLVAQAIESGFAKPGELASALSLSLRTVHRDRRKYVDGGAAELLPKKTGPQGPRMGAVREAAIRRWHRKGLSCREMARRLGVSPATVGVTLDRLGLPKGRSVSAQPAELPLPSADIQPEEAQHTANGRQVEDERDRGGPSSRATVPSPPVEPDLDRTLDPDPSNREIDRMLAAQGLLYDASPLFSAGESVPRAGVLLAIPALVATGVFEAAKKTYGHIGPAFYGLRTTLLTLLVLALLRVKRPENVKEYSPSELGRTLGLDRAPEVKTIRRKLTRLAIADRSEVFLQELVERRVESRSEAMGFLYVDGHVRVYSGKADLPKGHVARMRLSLPATQDVWVNDAEGDPLFFVTQQAHPQLVSALPSILSEVRRLVGTDRRVTVVFDRGGWSPTLFQKMEKDGFDVLTYRKGKSEPVADEDFVEHFVHRPGGELRYELHDCEVSLLSGTFFMRQVTRRQGEHQTKIVTTRRDLDVVDVAVRMFDRWRQENFFKYMREEYAIDALVEYGSEPDDPTRTVPNPARKALDREIAKARRKVDGLEAKYGAAAIDNPEQKRRSMRGFKIAHGTEIGVPLRQARAHLEQLLDQRSKLPSRVPVGEVKQEVVRLPREKKRLSDGLKMLAYQIETDLLRAVAPFYARSLDEGRRLLRAALQSAADLDVGENELRVTLAPQSSPHRSRAIAELCQILNDADVCFPGSNLRLRYGVRMDGDCATEKPE